MRTNLVTNHPRTTLERADDAGDSPTTDVLELTPAERWIEWDRFACREGDGSYHLSGLKECAGIRSRDTHISLDQIRALHRELGRIVDGLDRPASSGPTMSWFVGLVPTDVGDLADTAAVDADVLQRHFDGEGPLSQIASRRVFGAMSGKAAIA